jgi:uncharacterized protein (TIGR02246 family)
MKQYFILTTIAILLAGCAPPGPDPEQMIAGAKELDERFLDAFNTANVAAMMEMYMNGPDVVSFPTVGEPVLKGWDAIKSAMESDFENMKDARLTLIDPHYEVAGDAVITWGLWKMTIPLSDGATMEVEGRFSDVKKQQNGKWVFAMDHSSIPLPPPTGSAQ